MLVRVGTVVGCGAAVGFLTGFLGVGGGFLVLPVLVIALRMPVTAAIGTSLLIMVLNAAAALASRSGDLSVDWAVVVPFTLASVVGTLLGRRVADRLLRRGPHQDLRRAAAARRNLRGRRELARRMRASHIPRARPRLRRRPPPRRVHRTPAGRPRPGAGVQPSADRRGRGLRRHHRHHRRAGTGSPAVHVGGRGRRADPGPAREGRSRPRRRAPAGRAGPRHGRGAGREPQRRPPQRRHEGATTLVGWLEWQDAGTGSSPRWTGTCRRWSTRSSAKPSRPTVGCGGSRRPALRGGPRGPVPPDRRRHRRRHALAAVRPVGRRPGRGLGLPVRRRLLERAAAREHDRRAVVQPGGLRPSRREPARGLAGSRRRPVRDLRPALVGRRLGGAGCG